MVVVQVTLNVLSVIITFWDWKVEYIGKTSVLHTVKQNYNENDIYTTNILKEDVEEGMYPYDLSRMHPSVPKTVITILFCILISQSSLMKNSEK